ncbi:MAG: hypothetical protein AAFY88_15475 [Acidobacteriota bacterium]
MSTERARTPGPAPEPAGPAVDRYARERHERTARRASAVLAVAAVGVFVTALVIEGPVRPGDRFGLGFGIAATTLLVVAMLYVVRRRTLPTASKRRLGQSQQWLLVHIYGSLLFLLTMLLHTGLRWPEGVLSWALWIFSMWTVATGLLGLLAQRLVPRLLTAATEVEANYDRIPALVDELRRRSDDLAARCEPPLRLYYSKRMAPTLAAPSRFAAALPHGRADRRLGPLEHLRSLVSGDELERVNELERLYAAKLDLDTHYAWQSVLRLWLWLHVPAAVLLSLLVVVHIASALAY